MKENKSGTCHKNSCSSSNIFKIRYILPNGRVQQISEEIANATIEKKKKEETLGGNINAPPKCADRLFLRSNFHNSIFDL